MPGYNLSQLTEFSHALIYGFDPEGSPQALSGSNLVEDMLYPQIGQHDDLLDAYLYAQNTILSSLKTSEIPSLSGEQLKLWINGIHQRLGKTLLGCYNIQSGEYSDTPVFRWHSGAEIQKPILSFLSGLIKPKPTLDEFVTVTSTDLKVDKEALKDFMLLLLTIQDDRSIRLSGSQIKAIPIDRPHTLGVATFSKLQAYYFSERISLKDKAIIDKIVKICMPCEQYESAMAAYCTKVVTKLKTIDKDKLDDVVDFIADVFYDLTEIHPYPNCNGRTATCLVNTLLRYLGQPSILIRYPNERDNPDSIYSKVFENTEVNTVLLRTHLKQRILDTQKEAYSDPVLKAVIDHRIALVFLCQRIQKNHPEFNLSAAYWKVIDNLDSSVLVAFAEEHQKQLEILEKAKTAEEVQSIVSLQLVIAKFIEIEQELTLKKAKLTEPTAVNIINKLAIISGTVNASWKDYKKSTVFIFESDTEVAVDKAIALLRQADIGCSLTKTKRKDNGRHVIKIENIQPIKLFSFAPKTNTVTSEEKERSESKNSKSPF